MCVCYVFVYLFLVFLLADLFPCLFPSISIFINMYRVSVFCLFLYVCLRVFASKSLPVYMFIYCLCFSVYLSILSFSSFPFSFLTTFCFPSFLSHPSFSFLPFLPLLVPPSLARHNHEPLATFPRKSARHTHDILSHESALPSSLRGFGCVLTSLRRCPGLPPAPSSDKKEHTVDWDEGMR